MRKIILIINMLFLALFIFGCTEANQARGNFLRGGLDRNFSYGDGNFARGPPQNGNFIIGEIPEQMQKNIAITLGLVENASINEIKLYLGLAENSTNEELMQALKDKNIFGGRFK